MSPPTRLTLQIHLAGAWHDAALLEVADADKGIHSATNLAYDVAYYFDHGFAAQEAGQPAIDVRALSVRLPVDLSHSWLTTWPPFLVDLLPQGEARRRLAAQLGVDTDRHTAELPLLLRGAGAPIGNVRVKDAWAAEQARLQDQHVSGVTLADVFDRSTRFRDLVERFALLAAGSSSVQGDWPKLLLTQRPDGLWYPDSVVPDEEARDHVIVKMSRARFAEDRLILSAEAPYLELARAFGLRVGAPMTYEEDTLIIPRFDRQIGARGVVRLGQESLVAATGVVTPGHVTTHERYIETLHRVCTDPTAEIVEYVLRDVLSRAAGDPDNHGRNTALQKRPDGWIGLTPRFDFAPMVFDPGMIAPATSWGCLRGAGYDRYDLICAAITDVTGEPGIGAAVRAALLTKGDLLAELPQVARRCGVQDKIITRAFRAAGELAAALRRLREPG